jgi:hypothetical protein
MCVKESWKARGGVLDVPLQSKAEYSKCSERLEYSVRETAVGK